MPAPNPLHPTDQALNDYGLGKLDDELASTIDEHLESCADCRRRVAGLTSDSFLGRLRDVRKPSANSILGGSLVDGTLSLMQPGVATPPPPADTLPPGLANHPDYEIKRELGRGGMGVVYLAHNTMMGRDEVLKVMGRHIMDRPGVLERFQREIRAVAKLRHPNIVAAHSAFRIEGGLVFAMEYVEGLDLSRLVKTKGPLSVAHASYFIHHAALGLQHAHEKGLIHRDIKPHNLMLTHDGKARLVKVLDFGLAKATREEKIDGGLTSEGQALGTPDFIAPEQIVNALDVDIRADLYSLGGTLFYLLTGRPPFQATSLYDLYQAHMSRDADPLNLIRPEVPAELAALVAKMMAKEPKRRFQTPAEVAQALTPFFRKVGSPTKSLKGGTPQPIPTIVSRPAARSAPTPDRESTASDGRRAPSRKALGPIEGDGLWESLVEDQASLRPVTLAKPRVPKQRPPWASKPMVIAASLISLVVLGVIIITIRREDGREVKITIEANQAGQAIAGPIENRSVPREAGNAGTQPIKSHFVPLFNGKDLAGWMQPAENGSRWSVDEQGILKGQGGGQWKPAFLLTERQDFTNFRLRAKVRYQEPGFGWIEVRRTTLDLNDAPRYFIADGILSEEGYPAMGSVGDSPNYRDGTRSDWKVKSDLGPLDGSKWYTIEVTVVGNRIATSVDGKRLVEYVDVDEKYRKGAIGLVGRGDSAVEYREVMIETLPDIDRSPGVVEAGTVPPGNKISGIVADPLVPVTASDAPQPATDSLQPGTTWKGSWTFEGAFARGQTWPFEFTVRERNGVKLKANGTVTDAAGRLIPRSIEGTVKGDQIELEETGLKLSRTQMHGTLKGDTIRFKFDGTAMDGQKKLGSGSVKAKSNPESPDISKIPGAMKAPGNRDARAIKPAPLAAALNKRILMRHPNGIPLGEFVNAIREATTGPGDSGIPIHVDPFGLQDAEKSLGSTISIHGEGLPLKEMLRQSLSPLGLGYRIGDGILFVGSLEGFKEGPHVPIVAKSDRSAESKAVLVALEVPIPMKYPEETTLQAVIDDLGKTFKKADGTIVKVEVDPNGLHEAEKSMDSKIRIHLEGVPLRVSLHLTLHQIGMGYYVRKGQLTITDWGSIPGDLK